MKSAWPAVNPCEFTIGPLACLRALSWLLDYSSVSGDSNGFYMLEIGVAIADGIIGHDKVFRWDLYAEEGK